MRQRKKFFSILILLFVLYSVIVYTIGTANPEGDRNVNSSVLKGKILYQKHNCSSCHQIFGLGGFMGPDLTNVISEKGKDHSFAKIKWGDRKMPDFKLNDEDVDQLIQFLTYIDKTGLSPNRITPTPWYNYKQNTDAYYWNTK